MENNITVFLDMDGVLVNFCGAALAHHNKFIEPCEVRWNFMSQVGFTGANDQEFWEPLGFDFWANLDWTDEGKRLLQLVESIAGRRNIAIMTSPCRTTGCAEGKIAWIERECPAYARQYFLGTAKHLCASRNAILIDDNEDNCFKWAERGGLSILVPRPWNHRREETVDGRFDVEALAQELQGMVL